MGVTPYVILYILPALTSGALAAYAWRRRTDEARPFSLLMVAVAVWSIFHALSVADPTFEGTLFWAQIQYAGIVAVSPFWLLFALAYANQWERATPRLRVALAVVAVLTYAAVLTNGWHHLWWPQVLLDTTRPFVSIMVTRGPLFWLHAAYSYGCFLVGFGLFIYTMFESQLVYRNQARLVVAGALIPFIGNVALLFGLQLRAVDDPTPFLFTASGVIMYYATRRFHLLDLAPVAQHAIFEGIPDGVLVLDRRGAIAAINPAAASLLAIEPAAWVGRSARDLAGASPLADEILLAMSGAPDGAPITLTYADDDGIRTVEARLQLLPARGRGQAGRLLILRDVTAQARTQQRLDQRLGELTLLNRVGRAANAAAETDDLLRTITREIAHSVAWDRVLIGILLPDQTGIKVVVDESPHAAPSVEGTVIPASEFTLVFDILHEGETQVLNAADPTLADRATRAAMRRFNLQTALVVPLYLQGQPLGALLVGYAEAQAISSEDLHLYEAVGKLISDAIRRARLYEAANEASSLKSAFLATVSHELRTPLTSVIGYTDMLKQGVFGALPEHMREPLDHVRRGGQALLRMINDILDFSKMEAGHFNVERYPVDLKTVVHSVAGAMQPQIQQRGLSLEIDLAPDLPLVYADSARLEQVLTNLLANAIKFTEAGKVVVRADCQGGRVRLCVEDTGIGIRQEDLRRLFQPFHQVDNQVTRRFGGTGLGLAISRRLVGLMHGTLTVESTPGIGSKFCCELQAVPVGALKEKVVSR